MDDKEREEIIEDTLPASDAEEKSETAEAPETPDVPDSPVQVEVDEPGAGRRIRIDNLSPRQLLELDTCTRCSECVQWCPVYAQDEKYDLTFEEWSGGHELTSESVGAGLSWWWGA